jgi:hypothetical protein
VSINPANHALESKLLVSKGNINKFSFRHLLTLSIALYSALILAVRNLPLTKLIIRITESELVIQYLQTPFFPHICILN